MGEDAHPCSMGVVQLGDLLCPFPWRYKVCKLVFGIRAFAKTEWKGVDELEDLIRQTQIFGVPNFPCGLIIILLEF